jgi:chemotaxis protein CheD
VSVLPAILRERRYLQPGQLLVLAQPAAITTILGSCVAVCLWEPHRGIGGMNHFMLPMGGDRVAWSARFGPAAMEQLVTKMRDAGARLPLLRARVFGGACMFAEMQSADHLGRKNAAVALEYLKRRGIEVVQTDVGGNRGRKLIFHTDEGSTCLTLI